MKKVIVAGLFGMVLIGCSDDNDEVVEDVVTAPPSFSASQTFSVSLNGQQQVPNNRSAQSAIAEIEFDEDLLQIRASVDLSGVENVEAAHIHDGDLGFNGPVAFEFSDDDGDGTFEIDETDISADLAADLQDGDWYVNVHTTAFPDGEIRGQIVNEQTVIVTFPISGAQEVPAVTTSAGGFSYASVNTNDYSVSLTVRTEGVDDATMAHIHTGRVGKNGDVLVALEQVEDDANVWIAPEGTVIDESIFEVLASGGHYVNVHTPANPSGELRGQILTDNFALATFKIAGEQEVPAATTAASGDGYALVNTTDYTVELVAVTQGVDDATMAHIHTGRIGNNGDVLVGLIQTSGDLGTWETPEDTQIDAETFAVLASGGHYVNVHTPEFPSGEIRGQILTDNFALATFELSGEQEVPVVSTQASGDGYALVNTDDFSVELVALTEGVDNATMAHIHTGRVGSNGPVLVALEQAEDDLGKWTTPAETAIDAEIFEVLASGGHYVNVHTPANPDGELRGQIITDNFELVTFALSGEQEVPAVDSTATGSGYALIDTQTYGVELVALTEGVDDATMAHIHTGRIGRNGDVLVALEQSSDDAGKWMTPTDTAVNEEILAELLSGGHYVNVHTPEFSGGELRGQIVSSSDYVLVTFPLSGDQEVPAVTTSADGDGYALVGLDDFSVELQILTRGVSDATAAHIHIGFAGENGPILVGLEQDESDVNRWFTPAETAIDADIFEVLAAGGHYTNVHTPEFPSGEIRGQIE